MFVILSFIALITIYTLVHKENVDWRGSIAATALIWGILITGITELLSLMQSINFVSFLGIWGLIDIILGLMVFKLKAKVLQKNTNWQFKFHLPTEKSMSWLIGGTIFIIAVVGLIAIISPPNNWDSMDYHMSRVVHWMQNHSIAHYPTSYTPQLYQSPWSEYAILHLQILSGGDYFANLVQWLSMVGSIIIVSLIAKQLGAKLRGQVFSAVVAATIPMGILQASSTQNDYVVAFWIVCLAYYTLLVTQAGKQISWANCFYIGSSVGLAILTKGTAYFYVFPFVVWLLMAYIKRLRWQVWQPVLIIGFISLLLNIGHYLRNYDLFASVLGEPSIYENDNLGINVLISNVIRNLSLHLGTPLGFFNGNLNKLIQVIHIFLGLDVADTRTTFSRNFFVPGGWSTLGLTGNENSAGNLFHVLFFCLTSFVFAGKKSLRKQRYIFAYYVTVICTFLLFCYVIKWQAWNSRLHLPFFVLISPFIGLVLAEIKNKKVAIALLTLLLCSSLTWVFFNRYRPIISSHSIFQLSRTEQYFSNRPYLKNTYIQAVEFLNANKCSNIGLLLGNDPWEYPFWVLAQHNQNPVKFQHINVTNVSAKKSLEPPFQNFAPCGILVMQTKKSKLEKRENILFKDKSYTKAWDSADVGVFLKQ
ncbi:glycosyltransferase family 39 protein [Nostoc sp. FACHB-110]|uniref:ArnT family glycosyltransferase n=1 Tax=Nostoc sp. FACHB-110 TaxID=2692834 RepID=UPI0016875EDE|nr:glycosyltransferase family 39 protein [Nostoc sp. FACHB-110]MBD2440675.1 glycosyltransferase family 39 protein [Nostoc sp. FACHB-110]